MSQQTSRAEEKHIGIKNCVSINGFGTQTTKTENREVGIGTRVISFQDSDQQVG